jgi:adenylate kinase
MRHAGRVDDRSPKSGPGQDPQPRATRTPARRLVLLGPPGSGKSTQAAALAERLGVPHLSTGELLRDEAASGSARGRAIAHHLDRGTLVPDELVVPAVAECLARAPGGFVLDGFPRDLAQADALTDAGGGEPIDAVVLLTLPDDLARARLSGRVDDRSDDRDPDAVERRLRTFHDRTAPVADRYRRLGLLTVVDGAAPPERVTAAVLDALAGRNTDDPP